ncbi:MAG: putative membrane protein YdjX (TVP38/TMEM64 family) [Gammaproteobacteria bacterium]|jgi:uncharacterized membrane protein YdjX (TVP38/TMEM64 family)
MALAIIFNPLPSAPIVLSAGAIYGHSYGTLYIVMGTEIGAISAFSIARFVGYGLMLKTWRPVYHSDDSEQKTH